MRPGRLPNALAAYEAQQTAITAWLRDLPEVDFEAPSVLAGWDVRTLVGHMVLIREGMVRFFGTRSSATPLSAADYVRGYRRDVEDIAAKTATTTGEHPPAELVARFAAPVADPDLADRTVLDGPRGPITALDWVTTRVVDLVVHADDLSRSLPARDPVPMPRPALAAAVRSLAEILATQAPGRSVEVRIPPYVAVQAVAGPRHTRGTPANVVEADPVVWLRLATGRIRYADAAVSGEIRATGPRSDLSRLFPLLS